MEFPIKDESLALEMAYAEKPYRDMARIALQYGDPALQSEGLRLARLAVTASDDMYDAAMELHRTKAQRAADQRKIENIALYTEVTRPQRYISDLRKFSIENRSLMSGVRGSFIDEAVSVAKTLVLSREDDFKHIEQQALGVQEGHFIGTEGLSTKLRGIEDRDNWKRIENKEGSLLLSYTRHILGFRTAAARASKRLSGNIPFFDDLPERYRQEAYDAITDEWLAYVQLVIDFKAGSKISGKNRPLLYNSLGVLTEALTEERDFYGAMSDSEIIDTFENSIDFYDQCNWIKMQKEQKQQCELERQRLAQLPKPEPKTKAQMRLDNELHQELENEEQQNFANSTNIETFLPITDLDDISVVLKAIARKYAIEMGEEHGKYLGGLELFAGFKTVDFTEGIRPRGFHGRVENTRMRYLPLTDDFVDAFIKKRKLEHLEDFRILARIGVFSDLRSTGRGKIGESMQEYVLQARNARNPQSRNIRISKLKNLSGDKLVEYLNQESDKVAFAVERKNMLNPIGGGLPGLGKQR